MQQSEQTANTGLEQTTQATVLGAETADVCPEPVYIGPAPGRVFEQLLLVGHLERC
jgi:hypothetical protein